MSKGESFSLHQAVKRAVAWNEIFTFLEPYYRSLNLLTPINISLAVNESFSIEQIEELDLILQKFKLIYTASFAEGHKKASLSKEGGLQIRPMPNRLRLDITGFAEESLSQALTENSTSHAFSEEMIPLWGIDSPSSWWIQFIPSQRTHVTPILDVFEDRNNEEVFFEFTDGVFACLLGSSLEIPMVLHSNAVIKLPYASSDWESLTEEVLAQALIQAMPDYYGYLMSKKSLSEWLYFSDTETEYNKKITEAFYQMMSLNPSEPIFAWGIRDLGNRLSYEVTTLGETGWDLSSTQETYFVRSQEELSSAKGRDELRKILNRTNGQYFQVWLAGIHHPLYKSLTQARFITDLDEYIAYLDE